MKLTTPDQLDDRDRALLAEYQCALPTGGVCVNVLLGKEPWDLRPLVLLEGRVWLYRFSRTLDGLNLRVMSNEIEGFTVIPRWELRVVAVPALERFVLSRPYVQATLKDLLLRGELPVGQAQLPLAQKIIAQVRALARRNLVHGHISLSNISVVGGNIAAGEVIFLDPRVGVLNGSADEFFASEATAAHDLQHTADLYSLGRVLKVLLGDSLTPLQRAVADQLLLTSPKHRPALDLVEEAFCAEPQSNTATRTGMGGAAATPPKVGGGRVIGPQRSPGEPTAATHTAVAPPSGAESSGGRWSLFKRPIDGRALGFYLISAAAGLVVVLVGLRYRAPGVFFALVQHTPVFGARARAEYEDGWGSGERSRMRRVAQAALFDRDPAAQDAIIDHALAGGDVPGVPVTMIRAAFNPLWRDQLTRGDREAVLGFTLLSLVPDGFSDLPQFSELSAPVVLAVACQMPATNPSAGLEQVPLNTLGDLPDPVGSAFRELSTTGVKALNAPEAMGLAALVCGHPNANAIDAYIGRESTFKGILERLAIAFPVIALNEDVAGQFLASLRDQGGEAGTVLSWFDIDDLAKWSTVASSEKLGLLLNRLPKRTLSVTQYADLLTFPIPLVREQVVKALTAAYFREPDGELLALLATDQLGLSREQTIALVSTLQLPALKRAPFISAWFETKPAPESVVLVLLRRSYVDSTDQFNLEAARYLKKQQWRSSLDILKLLARHPEPLARSMAYAQLTPQDPAQRGVLEESLQRESDQNLKRSILTRLGKGSESGAAKE